LASDRYLLKKHVELFLTNSAWRVRTNIGPVQDITFKEVEQAMLKMGKATGPSEVPIEVIRISGLESILARIGNSMMYGDRMPETWRRSILIALYKGKGDAKECSN